MKCPVCKNEDYTANTKCRICQFSNQSFDFLNTIEANEWMKKIVLPYREKWVKKIETLYDGSFRCHTKKTPEVYYYVINGLEIAQEQFNSLPIKYCPLFHIMRVCTNIEITYKKGDNDFFSYSIMLGYGEFKQSDTDLIIQYNDKHIESQSFDSMAVISDLCDIIFGKYNLHKIASESTINYKEEIPSNFYSIKATLKTGTVLEFLFPRLFSNLFEDIFSNYFVSGEIIETCIMDYKEYEQFFSVTIDEELKRILDMEMTQNEMPYL